MVQKNGGDVGDQSRTHPIDGPSSTPARPARRAGPPLEPLPPTPMYSMQERAELAPAFNALTALAAGQDHALLFPITGTFGSGKTTALRQLMDAAQSSGIPVLSFAVDALVRDQPDQPNLWVQQILTAIAAALELDVSASVQEQPGRATLIALGKAISSRLEQDPARQVLLTFDNIDDVVREGRSLMRAVDDYLFTRLLEVGEGAGHRPVPAMAVVASRYTLRWQVPDSRIEPIRMHPLTRAQIAAQLDLASSDTATLDKLEAVTAGLAAAAARLWALGLVAGQEERPLFDRVYEEFVRPLLGDEARLVAATRAAALLEDGFSVTEFMKVAREVSYVGTLYPENYKAFYYSELDRLISRGLVRFDNAGGKYEMEEHLARLLRRWNHYHVAEADQAADREVIATIRQEPAAPAVGEPLPERVPAAPAEALLPMPEGLTGLAAVHHYITHAPATSDFVDREKAIRILADHLCQQPGADEQTAGALTEADITLLQGGAGSGKTALLRRFVQLAAQAAALYPSDELLVLAEPIDLELPDDNRFSNIRDTIIAELRKLIPDPPSSKKKKETSPFARYDATRRRWEALRDQLRSLPEDQQEEAARNKHAEIESLREQMNAHFYAACHEAATVTRRKDRRILLALDTFDYPIRSGLSASQFISEVAAELAGDLFLVIACRPPIEAERRDPEIRGDLRNYLPDGLREQVLVLDLDEPDYRIGPADITDYYQGRAGSWYEAAGEAQFAYRDLVERPVPVGDRDKVAAQLAQIIAEQESLPVLLNLLEFYTGLIQPAAAAQAGIDPGVGDAGAAGPPPAPPAPRHLANNPLLLSDLAQNPELFGDELIDGLLRSVPETAGGLSGPTLTALLLMSVLDRGVSWELLQGIAPTLRAVSSYTAAQVWDAIKYIVDPEGQGRISTLVKKVTNVTLQETYRLHDYVSSRFSHYTAWRLGLPSAEQDDQFTVVRQRDRLLAAAVAYLYRMGGENTRGTERAPGAPDPRQVYMWARSNHVYYSLRLAAVQYDDESAGRRSSDREIADPACAAKLQPANLIALKSGDLLTCLGIRLPAEQEPDSPVILTATLPADETAHVAFSYLYGKVLRALRRLAEYGFAEMLLQEARYFLYDQGGTEGRVANLTLPLVADPPGARADFDPLVYRRSFQRFAPARCLYQAALLYWQYHTEHYLDPTPWRGSKTDWTAILDLLRASIGTAEIDALVPKSGLVFAPGIAEADQARVVFHAWYTQALFSPPYAQRYFYYRRAYTAAAALLQERAVRLTPLQQGELHLEIERVLEYNPEIESDEPAQQHLNQALAQLEMARRHLAPGESAAAVLLLLARAHTSFGYMYRIVSRTWKAIPHYQQAAKLLQESADPEHQLRRAIAYNGLAYAVAIETRYDEAVGLWRTGMEILDNLIAAAGGTPTSRLRRARGRAHSTYGEILRFRGLSHLIAAEWETAKRYFAEARKSYEESEEAFYVEFPYEDVVWVNNVRQERLINEFYELRARDKSDDTLLPRERVSEIWRELRRVYGYSDTVRRLEILRHTGTVLEALSQATAAGPAPATPAGPATTDSPPPTATTYRHEALRVYRRGFDLAIHFQDAFNITRMGLGLVRTAIELVGPAAAEQTYYQVVRSRIDTLLLDELKDPYHHNLIVNLSEISITLAHITAEAEQGPLPRTRHNRILVDRLIRHFTELVAQRRIELEFLLRDLQHLRLYIEGGKLDHHIEQLFRLCELNFAIPQWEPIQKAILDRYWKVHDTAAASGAAGLVPDDTGEESGDL